MASRGRPRIHDHDLIKAMYYEGGLSLAEIARELSISYYTICQIIRHDRRRKQAAEEMRRR